jgi:carbonic anhydrase/acetyltransferase-like protein (isoleucine patch superfamily)
VGDDVLIGPHAHLTGCVIEGGSQIATGAIVFNGARIGTGAEVEFNAVVYITTVVPAGAAVPMGWFAGGQPAEFVAPGDWDRSTIRARSSESAPTARTRRCPTWPDATPEGWPCTIKITSSPISATSTPRRTRSSWPARR